MKESTHDLHFYLDEGLPRALATGLTRLGAPTTSVEPSTSDQEIIRMAGRRGRRGVWITRDLGSRRHFRSLILDHGISVAWIRDENAPNLKKAFLVLSFVYRYSSMLRTTEEPLYFVVRERVIGGLPSTVVKTTTDL